VPDWTAFGAVAGLILSLVLGLAWITSGALGGSRDPPDDLYAQGDTGTSDGIGATVGAEANDRAESTDSATPRSATVPTEHAESDPDIEQATEPAAAPEPARNDGVESIPTAALLANVALTHGGLGVLLLGVAALTGIPAEAFGVTATVWSTGALVILGGIGLGLALAALNVGIAATFDRIGIEYSDDLRSALAPESTAGWLLLLVVILPLVAGFEELLFRAVLIGVAATATGLSPWLFVVPATIAFALGHGLQGKGGIAVTGLLGGALGVAFVVTDSLALVVIAHYVVNAVEFLLKERLGWEIGRTE